MVIVYHCIHCIMVIITKMLLFFKLLCKRSAVPTNIPTRLFIEVDKLNVEFAWKTKYAKIIKTIPKKNSNELDLPYHTSKFITKLE